MNKFEIHDIAFKNLAFQSTQENKKAYVSQSLLDVRN